MTRPEQEGTDAMDLTIKPGDKFKDEGTNSNYVVVSTTSGAVTYRHSGFARDTTVPRDQFEAAIKRGDLKRGTIQFRGK
jgi:hypothetical protein